jgi:hypothetical protein
MRYHARSLYVVLGLADTKQVRVNLFEDGNPLPKNSAGADVQFDAKRPLCRGDRQADVLRGSQSELRGPPNSD